MTNRLNRKYQNRPKWLIYLPILTVLIVGLIYMYTSQNSKLFYNWNSISPAVKDTVIKITNHGQVTASIVGINAVTPQQYHRRTWLIRNASIEELIKLAEYPDGAVKAIVYEGLIRRDSTRRFEMLMLALQDTATFFNYQLGCEGEMLMLGEHLIKNVLFLDYTLPPPPPPDGNRKAINFSDKELVVIDSVYRIRMDKKGDYFQKYFEP